MVSAKTLSCPALLVAAPASGQGKTTVVAALARLHSRQGRRVRVFKCGPDFLDPQIHAIASGSPCYNVDLRMCGEADARDRLAQAAQDADLILVEGVMGLYDGEPSAAELAALAARPVMQHVIVTGRGAPEALIEAADTVTEMTLVKHAFKAGIPAQRGIED